MLRLAPVLAPLGAALLMLLPALAGGALAAAGLRLSTDSVSFGPVPPGYTTSTQLTVRSMGGLATTTTWALSGADAAEFRVQAPAGGSCVLPKNGSCLLTIVFAPDPAGAAGPRTATLTVSGGGYSDAAALAGSVAVAAGGGGVGSPPPSQTPELGSVLLFGSALAGAGGYALLRLRRPRARGAGS